MVCFFERERTLCHDQIMIRREARSGRDASERDVSWRRAIAGVSFAVVLVVVQVTGIAFGERASSPVERFGQNRCGVVDTNQRPPTTKIQADLDGDGRAEFYIATWGGVEKHVYQEGTHPPTLIRESIVYTSRLNTQYSCVELMLRDTDDDGDLDIIFAGHRELVVLTNRGGRFTVTRRRPVNLPAEARFRLHKSGDSFQIRAL